MKKKVKFVPNTEAERIEYLRNAIRLATQAHGSPCGCMLCDVLIFDCMAKDGEINLNTGQRNPPLEDK